MLGSGLERPRHDEVQGDAFLDLKWQQPVDHQVENLIGIGYIDNGAKIRARRVVAGGDCECGGRKSPTHKPLELLHNASDPWFGGREWIRYHRHLPPRVRIS